MVFTDAQIGAWVAGWLWPLFRIASFFMVIPIIGTQLVPMRVRIGLAFLTTIVVAPLLDAVPVIDVLSFQAVIITLQQIFIGTLLGFMFVLLTQLFVTMGQMVSMQMGLGFASMVDPANGVSVPILAQIFLVAITLIFLAMNGHLVMIEVIVESFRSWPVSDVILGPGGISHESLWSVLLRIDWMFAAALVLALPGITAVLIINLSFGIMTRAAPQMNVFSLGFPIGMMFGLFIVWVSVSGLLPQFDRIAQQTFVFLRELQGA